MEMHCKLEGKGEKCSQVSIVEYYRGCQRKIAVVLRVHSFVFYLPHHFQTHYGSVWRVTWAHPEFGQVLATCSFDNTAAVWEEQSMFSFI